MYDAARNRYFTSSIAERFSPRGFFAPTRTLSAFQSSRETVAASAVEKSSVSDLLMRMCRAS